MDTDKNKLLEIDQKTIKETIHCDNNFECLRNENYVCRVAKIERCIGGKVLFIECKDRFCNYKIGFGDGTICTCPTRKEIYNKYHI